ncbi:hypothetical protein EYW49_09600 [Siculibacillus lacustris]|uniref:Uncharacterized protein n=1 Tax=Siculibacillus lacustris TaxID=1549641 RepID=A0A4Q9VQT4_9HYPH|nr:hypothetical protein [Siculibacillus lacustris]TBW38195.1 hypothetical protein EYW49_09600 [Siculibacillus lacustris]
MTETADGAAGRPHVVTFRQILIWPLQLMPAEGGRGAPWEVLAGAAKGRWIELDDDFPDDAARWPPAVANSCSTACRLWSGSPSPIRPAPRSGPTPACHARTRPSPSSAMPAARCSPRIPNAACWRSSVTGSS